MNFAKTHHNFYGVCINAIKESKENIINKEDCIKNIEKLRDEKFRNKRKQKPRSLSYLYNPKSIQKLNKKGKMTLKKIILSYTESDTLPPIQKKEEITDNTAKTEINNKTLEKKISTKVLSNKQSKKNVLLFDSKKNQNLPTRYATLKRILEYLESNNITLNDYIQRNPFQSKPYQIPKSFEFLTAVKFKNYQFVMEALQYSNDYLFCFDYFGQTGYHWAAKLGNMRMLAILMDNGKYHNQKDFQGRTPLYLAAVNNDKNICEMLVRNKANAHLRDHNGKSPADVAGSKELKYYLGDLLTQPYSNPSNKQKIANFLREREKLIQYKIKKKKIEEEHNKILEDNKKENKKK